MSTLFKLKSILTLRSALVLTALSLTLMIGISLNAQDTPDDNTDVMSGEYFREHMIMFMAACEGEPKFIPISDETPILNITRTNRHPNTGKTVWLEPNCAYLLGVHYASNREPLPSFTGFTSHAVSYGYLVLVERHLADEGLPTELADIFLNEDDTLGIKYYTDSDLSGTFEYSERLAIDGLNENQLIFDVSKEQLFSEAFVESFIHLNNYAKTGGVFKRVAEFQGGPLGGRNLYLISVVIEGEVK